MDSLIRDTAERMFRDLQDEPDKLWSAMQDNGLTRAWSPEELGGTGLAMTDGFELISMAAGINCGVPFAETLFASYLLSAAGLETPDGQLSVATSDAGASPEVPFGSTADYVVRLYDQQIECVQLSDATEIENLGFDETSVFSESQTTVTASAPAPDWLNEDALKAFGALVRSAQLSGAMTRILDICLEHTSTREQFGRTLSKFQAVQHLLAEIAGETAASTAAVQAAAYSASLDQAPDLISIATAKARASEAAGIVAAHSIQVHGAIGYTEEYALARFVRRLWQWRDDFGSESHWQLRLGEFYSRPEQNSLTSDVFGA